MISNSLDVDFILSDIHSQSCKNTNFLIQCVSVIPSHQISCWLLVGLKRYAQTTIRYDTRYGAHDTICSVIHLPFLAGKQRLVIPACDQKHRTPPTTTACTLTMRNGYNNGGLLRVSRCSVFVMNLLVLLEYTGCYLWYLIFFTNFGMCYKCIVSYLPLRISRYVP